MELPELSSTNVLTYKYHFKRMGRGPSPRLGEEPTGHANFYIFSLTTSTVSAPQSYVCDGLRCVESQVPQIVLHETIIKDKSHFSVCRWAVLALLSGSSLDKYSVTAIEIRDAHAARQGHSSSLQAQTQPTAEAMWLSRSGRRADKVDLAPAPLGLCLLGLFVFPGVFCYISPQLLAVGLLGNTP